MPWSAAEFTTYMNYIRGSDDQGQPDYKYLWNLFSRLFRRKGFKYDNVDVTACPWPR